MMYCTLKNLSMILYGVPLANQILVSVRSCDRGFIYFKYMYTYFLLLFLHVFFLVVVVVVASHVTENETNIILFDHDV